MSELAILVLALCLAIAGYIKMVGGHPLPVMKKAGIGTGKLIGLVVSFCVEVYAFVADLADVHLRRWGWAFQVWLRKKCGLPERQPTRPHT